MDNILSLHNDLRQRTYRHGPYKHFRIADPKPRDIHKASVRDRLLHHALHRKLYPFFDRRFIADSYSCRIGKGTHRAINSFRQFSYKVSKNHTRTAYVLKCDIKKFFANIDHSILKEILARHIPDQDTRCLLGQVIDSFSSHLEKDTPTFLRMSECPVGLPLGNLTSQLLVNIYMNEFDQFVKHKLKAKYYVRYADDFVILSYDHVWLAEILQSIGVFLRKKLKLELHPNKVFIKTVASGVDFLGWVHFNEHCVLRTATKQRMFRTLGEKKGKKETIDAYLGLLNHGNSWKLRRKLLDEVY